MEKQTLITLLQSACNNEGYANFSAEDTNQAAIDAIYEACGLSENCSPREFRAHEDQVFALIEEAIDEIMPAKLQNVLKDFAEVRQFARDAEVVFNIEKIGKNRAKLTISKGARGGIYRAAKLDRKYFSLSTSVETVAVFVTLEEILLGTVSLSELFNNILEGFEEIVYKDVFNALASGKGVAGYDSIQNSEMAVTGTAKASLGIAIDKVMPYVKQYGTPTIFGSYQALSALSNEAVSNHPELLDSADRRNYGYVQVYKGARIVELPNYLIDNTNSKWFYDPSYVFVLPSGAKPVKVALKGDLTIVRNTQATGSQKWEAHKLIGVGLAMANNFATIKVTDVR